MAVAPCWCESTLASYGDDPANWNVVLPLEVLAPPTDVFADVGANVTFPVTASGNGPLTYQWRFSGALLTDGNGISGATTATLRLDNVQPEQAGAYTVDLSDATSSATSLPWTLKMLVKPTIVVNPQAQSVVKGDNVTLSVVVDHNATLPVTYEWRQLSTPVWTNVVNEPSDSYTITNVQETTKYRVAVRNAATTGLGLGSSLVSITVVADTDGDHVPDDWENMFGLNPANADDGALDSDGDGMSNLNEYRAGTNPTNAASYLKVIFEAPDGSTNVLQFEAVAGKTYTVQFRDSLAGSWLKLADVPAPTSTGPVDVTDATVSHSNPLLSNSHTPNAVTYERPYEIEKVSPPQFNLHCAINVRLARKPIGSGTNHAHAAGEPRHHLALSQRHGHAAEQLEDGHRFELGCHLAYR